MTIIHNILDTFYGRPQTVSRVLQFFDIRPSLMRMEQAGKELIDYDRFFSLRSERPYEHNAMQILSYMTFTNLSNFLFPAV